MAGSRFEPRSDSYSIPLGLNKPRVSPEYVGTENTRAWENPEITRTDRPGSIFSFLKNYFKFKVNTFYYFFKRLCF